MPCRHFFLCSRLAGSASTTVAEALQHRHGHCDRMHEFGMAHQDLSAENILLRSYTPFSSSSSTSPSLMEMSMLLADFGQVCGQATCTASNRRQGMPLPRDPVGKSTYHCPEMANAHIAAARGALSSAARCTTGCTGSASGISVEAKTYDAQAVDSWQLGVLLLIMLTGQPPFDSTQPSRGSAKQQAWFRHVRSNALESHTVMWRDTVTSSHDIIGSTSNDQAKMTPRELKDVLSFEAMELLKRLLHAEPECRPTMLDVLSDPWMLMVSSSCGGDGARAEQAIQQCGLDLDC